MNARPASACASILLCSLLLVLAPAGRAWADEPGGEPGAAPTEKERAAALIEAMKDTFPENRAKAAAAAAELQDPSLLSPLLRLLSDTELHVREAAMGALATRQSKSDCHRAAAALNPRLGRFARRPEDHYELMVVIQTLAKLKQPSSIKPLIDGIALKTDIEEVRARLMAVAEVPHVEAIDRLIQFLDRGRRGGAGAQREAARKALMHATGIRMNRNPDEWRAWWRDARKTFDFEAIAAARAAAEAERAAKEAEREAKKKAQEERRNERKNKPKPEDPEEGGGTSGGTRAPD